MEFQRECRPLSDSLMRDPDITSHAVLRKHYKHLLPWLSNQPKPCADAENIEAEALSYRQISPRAVSLNIYC